MCQHHSVWALLEYLTITHLRRMRRDVIGSPGLLLASLHNAHLHYSERRGPKRVMGCPKFAMLRFAPKKNENGGKGEVVTTTTYIYRRY